MVDITHYKSTKNKKSIKYPSIPSFIAPVPHDNVMPISTARKLSTSDSTINSFNGSLNDVSEDKDICKERM